MSLDVTISTRLVRPFLDRAHGRDLAPVPVLMYHRVSDSPEDTVRPYYRTCTSPARFQEQMQWLADHGFHGMTLGDGLGWLAASQDPLTNVRLPSSDPRPPTTSRRPVVLTFDDGYRDFLTAAMPVLETFGFTATVFLPTAFIGSDRRSFQNIECLTWAEVNRLAQRGIEFGSHTVTHPRLAQLSWEEVHQELTESKATIENAIGTSVATFAHPYAFPAGADYPGRLEQVLRDSSYCCCATTEIGRLRPGDNPYRIRRLPVNSCDDARLFGAKLAGAYDWVRVPQSLWKLSKRLLSRERSRAAARVLASLT
jgi:peptidoglycan/xylan/chitin deacetylase (PgdA/CDA1 family)